MKNKLLGVLAALAIALGLTVVVSAPVEAHTSGGTYTSVCQADGTYKLTWIVFADNAPGGTTVDVTAISPASLGSKSGPGNQDQKFEQIIPGDTVQPEASFSVSWSDGFSLATPVILKALLVNGTCVDTTEPPPALLCTDITDGSFSPKVDADANDPFYVTIPAGQTLTAYCVKAGTEPVIVTLPVPFVGPGDVQIDHPSKDSVSHYQLQLITTPPPPIDLCANIADVQETVPDGLIQVGDDCLPPRPDDKVTYTEWVDGVFECGDTEVEQTRNRVETPWELVSNVWVEDPANAQTFVETGTRALDPSEITVCPTTPPTEPPVDEELPTPSVLPNTGDPWTAEDSMILLAVGFALAFGALLVVFAVRNRRASLQRV